MAKCGVPSRSLATPLRSYSTPRPMGAMSEAIATGADDPGIRHPGTAPEMGRRPDQGRHGERDRHVPDRPDRQVLEGRLRLHRGPRVRELPGAHGQQAALWLRRNRSDQRLQDALDVALLEAVTEDREVPVHLLLWAGADPHRKVPSVPELGDPEACEEPEMLSGARRFVRTWRSVIFLPATAPDAPARRIRR